MALEPITRAEQIIAGKDLQPITRMEKFLKEYGGGSSGGGVGDLILVEVIDKSLWGNIPADVKVEGFTYFEEGTPVTYFPGKKLTDAELGKLPQSRDGKINSPAGILTGRGGVDNDQGHYYEYMGYVPYINNKAFPKSSNPELVIRMDICTARVYTGGADKGKVVLAFESSEVFRG